MFAQQVFPFVVSLLASLHFEGSHFIAPAVLESAILEQHDTEGPFWQFIFVSVEAFFVSCGLLCALATLITIQATSSRPEKAIIIFFMSSFYFNKDFKFFLQFLNHRVKLFIILI
jgi:hypothetical protein